MTTATLALVLGVCVGMAAIVFVRRGTSPPTAVAVGEVGATGVALTALSPHGIVRAVGEEWSAMADGAPIAAGESIRIVARHGLRVQVRRLGGGSAATDKAFRDARAIGRR